MKIANLAQIIIAILLVGGMSTRAALVTIATDSFGSLGNYAPLNGRAITVDGAATTWKQRTDSGGDQYYGFWGNVYHGYGNNAVSYVDMNGAIFNKVQQSLTMRTNFTSTNESYSVGFATTAGNYLDNQGGGLSPAAGSFGFIIYNDGAYLQWDLLLNGARAGVGGVLLNDGNGGTSEAWNTDTDRTFTYEYDYSTKTITSFRYDTASPWNNGSMLTNYALTGGQLINAPGVIQAAGFQMNAAGTGSLARDFQVMAQVPEPASLALLGLTAVAALSWRRRS